MVGCFVVECWLLFCPRKHTTTISWFSFSIRKKLGCIVWKKSLITQKTNNASFVPKSRPWSNSLPGRNSRPSLMVRSVENLAMLEAALGKPKVCSRKSSDTLQGINISHLGKRKIIFKMPFWGDMLVPWRVLLMLQKSQSNNSDVSKTYQPSSTGFLATFQSSIVW